MHPDHTPTPQSEEEHDSWLLANLHEQCELLEIVLVYHKDYYHYLPALLQTAKTFQVSQLAEDYNVATLEWETEIPYSITGCG